MQLLSGREHIFPERRQGSPRHHSTVKEIDILVYFCSHLHRTVRISGEKSMQNIKQSGEYRDKINYINLAFKVCNDRNQ